MSLEIYKGAIINVHKASAGIKKDGTPWALITAIESENQPEGLENPSKSNFKVKFWLDKLPEGATNGCCVKIVDFDRHKHTRDVFEANGNKSYRETCVYQDATLVVVPEKK